MVNVDRKLVDDLTKKLIDDGKLIEAGFVSLKMMAMPPNASQTQISECRKYFFAGAQHLFGSLMSALDEDKEPTQDDMDRMSKIHSELETFKRELIDSVST